MSAEADRHDPNAAPLRLLMAVAMRAQSAWLLPLFTQRHGIEVAPGFDLNPSVATRIDSGEPYDLGMTNQMLANGLTIRGRIAGDGAVDFGRIPLAIGRRDGSNAPVAQTEQAIRTLLQNTPSVAYTAAGASGKTFLALVEHLELGADFESQMRPMGPGQAAAAAADGTAALAVAPLTTVLATPGLEIAAILPAELGTDIAMSVFMTATCADRPGAAALIRFLTDPEHDARLEAEGVLRQH